ncbi:MAG: glycosyltransferase [Bryobacterales bacterium]|nr:glycosyltransferase [Bryobacterales bacterium]
MRPPQVRRASASRYLSSAATVEQWGEILRQVMAAQPKSTPGSPRISVITPAWNTQVAWFAQAAISLLEQSCAEWEWCVVDDASTRTDFHALLAVLESTGRVKFRKLLRNSGISTASNEGLAMASAEYACLLDHDDLLAPDALAKCLQALDSGLDAVYTDEDKVDEDGIRNQPFYKPDWSPEYFRGVMYVGHLLCVRRETALDIGGFDARFDGVQDFEFLLRYSERSSRIGHLAEILYHWRAVPGSIAASQDAKGDVGELQKRAVTEHLRRLNIAAVVEPGPATHTLQILPVSPDFEPRVSIVIAVDAPDRFDKCLASIAAKSAYENFEIVCVGKDGGGACAERHTKTRTLKSVLLPGRFDLPRAANFGAEHATGDFLMFMSPALEVITENWIDCMLFYARQKDVGAVGGLVAYPDGALEHAGIVLGCRGTAGRLLHKAPADSTGYFGVICCAREVSAVASGCMMIRREMFSEAGKFAEDYSSAYHDVDLCLKLRSLGLRNIYTPRARFLYGGQQWRDRHSRDGSLFLKRWGKTAALSDSYYNRNLNLDRCDYTFE